MIILRLSGADRQRGRLRTALVILFLVGYPLLVHIQVSGGDAALGIYGLLAAFAVALLTALCYRDMAAALLAIFAAAAVAMLFWEPSGQLFTLAPILINLALAVLFASSLRPGSTPVITRFAQAMTGDLDAKTRHYARRVTLAWTLLFVLLTIELILLKLFATARTWSLFANFLNYVLLGAFFLFEYRIRVRHLHHLEHPSFPEFIRRLWRLRLRERLR